jgi:hypothetical protein
MIAMASSAAALSDDDLTTELAAADGLGTSPWLDALRSEAEHREAAARVKTLVAETPPHVRDFGFVDYDEQLNDDQVAGLLSGDHGRRSAAIEETDEVHFAKVQAGITQYIRDDVDVDDRTLLDERDMLWWNDDEALARQLEEVDTSTVFDKLLAHTPARALVVDTGYHFEAPMFDDDPATEEAAAALTVAIAELGISSEVAQGLAAEIVEESMYSSGPLLVIWYGDLDPVVSAVLAVHHGNQPDLPHTFRWTRPGSGRGLYGEAGVQIGVLASEGAGHFVSVPWEEVDAGQGGRMAVTVPSVLTDVRLDGATGYSWTDDVAGIVLTAIMADATVGRADGVDQILAAIRRRPKAGRYRLRLETGLTMEVFETTFAALLANGCVAPQDEGPGFTTTIKEALCPS